MISSIHSLSTEDLDRADAIHNLGGGLDMRVHLRGNRNETGLCEVNGET